MNPLVATCDDFFSDFNSVSKLAYAGTYGNFTLGVDGVTYPHICTEVPKAIEYEFLYKLERILGVKVSPEYLFLRAMPEGTVVPSKTHSDRDMGAYTAHVYMSPLSKLASTSFLKHRDFGHVCTPEMEGLWGQSAAEWDKYLTFYGKPNRLLVHRAEAFHCAEPSNGFGVAGIDARLMLTCFFNVQ
jgi:hypothetical protein